MRAGAAHQYRTDRRIRINAAPHLREVTVQRRARRIQVRLIGDDYFENSRQRRLELQCRMGGAVGGE